METGPKSSVEHVVAGLDQANVDSLDFIVVTHIHLDHAGAAGTLIKSYPDATVVVHPEGAPHLVDPTKLWLSASRIYGEDMERLWGGIDPVPTNRIRVIENGETLDLGGRSLRAIETPGHARHHHAFEDDATGITFAGDALGVRLPDIGTFRPATPPPEFNLRQAIESITKISEAAPTAIWLTHFESQAAGQRGCNVEEACSRAIESLQTWAEWVRSARRGTRDIEEAADFVRAQAERDMDADLTSQQIQRMEQTTSYWMNTWGYMRYMDKEEPSTP